MAATERKPSNNQDHGTPPACTTIPNKLPSTNCTNRSAETTSRRRPSAHRTSTPRSSPPRRRRPKQVTHISSCHSVAMPPLPAAPVPCSVRPRARATEPETGQRRAGAGVGGGAPSEGDGRAKGGRRAWLLLQKCN